MGGRPTSHSFPNKKSPADTGEDRQHSQSGGSFVSCCGAQQAHAIWTPARRAGVQEAMDVPCLLCTTVLETCITAKTKERPLPFCTPGHHRHPAAGARGCWAKPEDNARSRPRQGHRKLIPGTKKTPSRCELQGGLERSLAAAYFPT